MRTIATIRNRYARRTIGRHVLGLGAAVTVLAGLAGSAGAVVCADQRERESLTVRNLQTRLMVAALTCGARDDYNAFVLRFRPALADHGGTMKSYFNRAFGKRSPSALNAYITEIANEASALSIADRPAYCAASRKALDALLSSPRNALHASLVRVAMEPGPAREAQPACQTITRR